MKRYFFFYNTLLSLFFVVIFSQFSGLHAQERVFVYIKATEKKSQLQQLVYTTLKEKYTVSNSKKLLNQLKKHQFLKDGEGNQLRVKLAEKKVVFILLLKLTKVDDKYQLYSRMIPIADAQESIFRSSHHNFESIVTELQKHLAPKEAAKETPKAPKFTSIWSWLTIVLTCILIVTIFIYSLYLLITRGRVVLSLCLLQLTLFLLLFLEIYYLLGEHHFLHGDSDPAWYQWLIFMVFHIFRAIDVIDFLEEFKLGLYFLKHASVTCGIAIVFLRLMVDIFVIAIIVKFLDKKIQRIYNRWEAFKKRWKKQIVHFGIFLAVVSCAAYLLSVFLERWSFLDTLVLWPLDNILRVIDIGDCFQTFDWTLHNVFDSPMHSVMEVYLRFAVGVYIAKLVDRWTTVYFRGAGLTVNEILGNLDNKDLNVVKIMLIKLGKIGPEVKERTIPKLLKLVTKYQIDFTVTKTSRKEYVFFGEDTPSISQQDLNFILAKTIKEIDRDAKELGKYLTSSDHVERESACKLLRCLGAVAIPEMLPQLANTNGHIREMVLDHMNHMTNPAGKWCHTREYLNELPLVIRMLQSYDIDICKTALSILKSSKVTSSIAGSAIPIIRKMLKETEDREVKKLCKEVVEIYKGICFDNDGNFICY